MDTTNIALHLFQEPAYGEHAESLIEELKHLLFSYNREDNCNDHDLIKRIQIVDTIQCLRIDRHFQHKITRALKMCKHVVTSDS